MGQLHYLQRTSVSDGRSEPARHSHLGPCGHPLPLRGRIRVATLQLRSSPSCSLHCRIAFATHIVLGGPPNHRLAFLRCWLPRGANAGAALREHSWRVAAAGTPWTAAKGIAYNGSCVAQKGLA